MYLAGYVMLMCSGLLLGIIFENMSIVCMDACSSLTPDARLEQSGAGTEC